MDLIPAVDLKEGECVRLFQGKRDRDTHYSDDPVGMAHHWEQQGASRLHLVDLDGAFEGESGNREIIEEIINTLSIPVQVGGGLRSTRAVNDLLSAGADAGIIGTAGVNNPEWLGQLVDQFGPDRIIAGVDTQDGQVMVEGWEEQSSVERLTWARQLEKLGIKRVIYTDVSRDGAETGPDIPGTKELLENTELEIIASGGVGTLDHLRSFDEIHSKKLVGIIVGRALYEENFTFTEGARVLPGAYPSEDV
ncbi:MAG: 1-(5-phosphoribosyl)-5-[(5-phosphoribosylamino)methylideneamino]imidazole-4-carboxamide isomerase [bacterium]